MKEETLQLVTQILRLIRNYYEQFMPTNQNEFLEAYKTFKTKSLKKKKSQGILTDQLISKQEIKSIIKNL